MPSNHILTVKASAVSLKCVAALRLQRLMVAGLGFGFFHAETLHVQAVLLRMVLEKWPAEERSLPGCC